MRRSQSILVVVFIVVWTAEAASASEQPATARVAAGTQSPENQEPEIRIVVERHIQNVPLNVNRLLPERRATHRYYGSLTTPPCSERVKWRLMTTAIQLSTEQVGTFTALIEGNNRPVPPLNDRPGSPIA